MRLGSLPAMSFLNHHSLITQLLDAVLNEILTALLNKPVNYVKL